MIEIVYILIIMLLISIIFIQLKFRNQIKKISTSKFIRWILIKRKYLNFCLFGLLIYITMIYMKNSKLIFIISLLISIILSLRFILKVLYYKEFESYTDLMIGTFSLMILILELDILFPIASVVNNLLFEKDVKSHVFQLFIFHICFLIIIYTFFMAFIYFFIFMGSFFILFMPIEEDLKKAKIKLNKFKNRIRVLSKKFLDCDINYLFNKYFNPAYKIKWVPIYKNIKFIRNLLLISYIVTGILIIYYWPEFTYFLNNNKYLSFFGKDIYKITIEKNNFDDYRLIFITPLLGILFSKVFKNDKK